MDFQTGNRPSSCEEKEKNIDGKMRNGETIGKAIVAMKENSIGQLSIEIRTGL